MSSIQVVYEDANFLVIDKPSGVVVNDSDTTKGEFTLQQFINNKFPELKNNKEDSEFKNRSGIVHRIDKETSGILLVAKNRQAFENLQNQFKERIVKKTYIALVHGKINEDQGEISVPLGRLPWNRKRFGVLAGGREAFTFYKVIERFEKPFTLLELNPKTGRTHQIRVHLKYFNHPIFSDDLYAGRKTSREDRKILPRLFLHAKKIQFKDPISLKEVSFESSLPYELTNALEWVRN